MSNVKEEAEKKIDDMADAGKKTVGKAVDKTKDAAHAAGKKMQKVGKQLKEA